MEGEQSYWAQTHGNCSSNEVDEEFNLDISAESKVKSLQQAYFVSENWLWMHNK